MHAHFASPYSLVRRVSVALATFGLALAIPSTPAETQASAVGSAADVAVKRRVALKLSTPWLWELAAAKARPRTFGPVVALRPQEPPPEAPTSAYMIYVTPDGFYPSEGEIAAGTCAIVIRDKTGLDVQLSYSVKEADPTKAPEPPVEVAKGDTPAWGSVSAVVTFTEGTTISIVEATHPEWVCQLTVVAATPK